MTMTGTDPDPRDGPRRWAAAQLRLVPDAGPEAMRAAFLRLLEQTDFAPPARCRRAWRVLAGGGAPAAPDPDALVEEDRCLGAEAEAFAGEFWSLAPGERRRRWAELSARCADAPGPRARLRQLEAGLSVRAAEPGAGDGRVGELAAAVQDIFVLGPGGRAAARQALRRRAREDPRDWEAAARALRKQHPELAELQPGLVADLEGWRQQQRHLEQMRQRLKTAANAPPAGKRSYRWVWVIVAAASLLGRALVPHSSDRPTPMYSAPQPARTQQGADRPQGPLPLGLPDGVRKPPGLDEEDWKRVQDALKQARKQQGRKTPEKGADLGPENPPVRVPLPPPGARGPMGQPVPPSKAPP
jgi:hypothetical protein